MNVEFSPELRQSAEMPLIEKASNVLADIQSKRSTLDVMAEWSRVEDHRRRPLYRLSIRDSADQVFTDFSPDELQIPQHVHFRMARLLGDLLEVRNNQQHQRVQAMLGEMMAGSEVH